MIGSERTPCRPGTSRQIGVSAPLTGICKMAFASVAYSMFGDAATATTGAEMFPSDSAVVEDPSCSTRITGDAGFEVPTMSEPSWCQSAETKLPPSS